MKKYIYITLLVITICSCHDKIQKIIANQDKLFSLIQNKELIHRGSIWLITNQDSLENFYVFKVNDSIKPHEMILDTFYIEFSPDNVIGIQYDSTYQSKKQLSDYITNLRKQLDSLYIDQFIHYKYGSSFYLTNGKHLEYMPKQTEEIENYKKVGEGWYLYDD
jgi:hypothetical protein